MEAPSDQGDRPLGAGQARASRLELQQRHVVRGQPKRQFGVEPIHGRCGDLWKGGLCSALDETAQETRPTTPPGRRGVEPSDQISWQAYSEAVHGRGDVSDNAGAKPILP
jgi:hypothetical protein